MPGEEMDVRERIYDMVRPLDWMQEAPEPPGTASVLVHGQTDIFPNAARK